MNENDNDFGKMNNTIEWLGTVFVLIIMTTIIYSCYAIVF